MNERRWELGDLESPGAIRGRWFAGTMTRFSRQMNGLPAWEPTDAEVDAWAERGLARSRRRREYLRRRVWADRVAVTTAVTCIIVIVERVTG